MTPLIPQYAYFFRATGTHKENKNARDSASRQVGLGRVNLVTVSSVLPPGVQEIDRETFDRMTRDGQIVFAVHGVCEGNVPGQRLCAALGRARPWDKGETGYVTEIFEWTGIEEDVAARRVETMALQLFAEEIGIPDFVADDVWKPGQSTYDLAGHKVEIDSLVASVVCDLDGDYSVAMVGVALL